MKQTHCFTDGQILLPLLRFSLPVLAALFLQTLYGAVDLWVGSFFLLRRRERRSLPPSA